MLRFIVALALVALSLPAEARPRHIVQPVCIDSGDNLRPCLMGYGATRAATAVSHSAGGRPAGCPHAWCGCWLMARLGLSDRSLWLARRWATIGSNAGGPRVHAIAVWGHHVGLITAVNGNQIMLLSGNDGNAVRERWRPTRGIIAYRFVS
jgi:hypothetical protein